MGERPVGSRHRAGRRSASGIPRRAARVDAADLLGDLPVVHPTAQADTERLRRGFPRLVDEQRAAAVLGWCDWVDDILGMPQNRIADVLAHGDLHGYNQVWDRTTRELRVVVDLEECGIADPHFDLRYLPGNAEGPRLLQSVMSAYASLTGRRSGRLTSPGVERPHAPGRCVVANRGPGPVARRRHPTSWVDDLEARLAAHLT